MIPKLDFLFLNLHRRYLNYEPTHGGFLGIYYLSAFLREKGYEAKEFWMRSVPTKKFRQSDFIAIMTT